MSEFWGEFEPFFGLYCPKMMNSASHGHTKSIQLFYNLSLQCSDHDNARRHTQAAPVPLARHLDISGPWAET